MKKIFIIYILSHFLCYSQINISDIDKFQSDDITLVKKRYPELHKFIISANGFGNQKINNAYVVGAEYYLTGKSESWNYRSEASTNAKPLHLKHHNRNNRTKTPYFYGRIGVNFYLKFDKMISIKSNNDLIIWTNHMLENMCENPITSIQPYLKITRMEELLSRNNVLILNFMYFDTLGKFLFNIQFLQNYDKSYRLSFVEAYFDVSSHRAVYNNSLDDLQQESESWLGFWDLIDDNFPYFNIPKTRPNWGNKKSDLDMYINYNISDFKKKVKFE
jgi:hypothetical protein